MAERFSRDSMRLGGILTAMVTPFGADGGLDEDAAVRLMHHLLENGSDGLVLAGSTGEGATMTDEEKVRLWELGVAESGDAPVIAGTGTYDTRHSVELTERAHEAGVDAMLVVTPYYVRPTGAGSRRTTRRWQPPPTGRSWPTTSRAARPRTCRTTCSRSWLRSTTSRR